jgi:GNAT superfamily N-acetyltransferase
MEWSRSPYVISTDPARIDVDAVHRYLSNESYWAKGIPRDRVERSIAGSLCFGLYAGEAQVGFARVVTDRATFAYLCDVYVDAAHRTGGLGKWLMEVVMGHPDLQGLRRFLLGTRDAHGLYAKYGFTPMKAPDRFMEKHDPDVYTRR